MARRNDLMSWLLSKSFRRTENKAIKKNPLYAERYALRRPEGKPYITMLDDELDMSMWEEEARIFDAHRPWWGKVLLHAHWWMDEYGIAPTRRNIKYFIQRGRRGYSDRDVWGFDYHLTNIILNGVKDLKQEAHGYPCGTGGVESMEDWMIVLEEIIVGMEAALTLSDITAYDYNDKDAVKELHDRHELAMDHLKVYYFALWD